MTLGVVHTTSIVQWTSTPEAAYDNGYSEHQAGTDDSKSHCHHLSATSIPRHAYNVCCKDTYLLT